MYVAPGGSFAMSGGSVTGNEAETSGGGVTVAGAGDAVPVSEPITVPVTVGGGGSDGVIDEWKDGGTVEGEGSVALQALSRAARAPRNSNAASFTLTGGSITGNTAGEYGGGVNVRGSVSVDTGSVITITGNTVNQVTNNVYFPEAHTDLTVNGIPASGSEIGVRMATPGQFAAMGNGVEESAAQPFFASDDPDYKVLTMENGLKLGKQQDTPSISIDYQNETLTGFESGADYTINGVTVTPDADGTITIQEDWFDKTISIVRKGDGNMADSEAQSLDIPARPAAPAVTGGVNRIDGATTAMEYSTDSGMTWTAFTEETVANISAGTYLVRSQATDTIFAGQPTAEITVTKPSGGSGGSSSTRYPVTVEDSAHGQVESNLTRARRGQTVTLTVTPDEGYQLDRLTVRDADGDRIDLERVSDSRFTFEMPRSKVTVEAVFTKIEPAPPLPFADVPTGHWAYEAIRYVWENGLMAGTSATAFGPDAPLTRGQLVTILWRAAGSPQVNYLMDFSDVDPAAWYGEAVRWASALRIAGGYGDGRFGPDDPVTREQLAVMLYQYAWNAGYDLTGGGMALREYDDYEAVSPWALEALDWAVSAGILSGTGATTLSPQSTATRAQAAVMLERFCELDR